MIAKWPSKPNGRDFPKNLFFLGLILSLFYWFTDSALDAFMLNRVTFYNTLLSPEPHELIMRSEVILFIIILGYFIYKSIYSYKSLCSETLKANNNILKAITNIQSRYISESN